MKSFRILPLLAAVMLIAGGAVVHADADTLHRPDNPDNFTRVFGPGHLPRAVADAFYAVYPQGRIDHIEKEENGNLVAYEIHSVDGDIHRNILYRPDGTPIKIAEVIPSSELPSKIANTLSKQIPEGVVYRAERVTRDNSTSFEIIVEDGNQNIELVMTPKGKIIGRKEVADYSAVTDQTDMR